MDEGRKKRPKFEEPQARKTEEAQKKISFESWVSLRLSKKDNKDWIKPSVQSFFKSLGLSDQEEIKTYDNAFEKF